MSVFEWIILIAYISAGWWAANKVWYARHVYFTSDTAGFYVKNSVLFCFSVGYLSL